MGKKTSLKTKNKEILDTMIVNPINRRESFESRATLEHFETIEQFIQDKFCKFLDSPTAISRYFLSKNQTKCNIPCLYSNMYKARMSLGTKNGWFAKNFLNRKNLIFWLEEVCSAFKLPAETMCLTVLLVDTLSQKYDEHSFESHLIVLLCLSIATKLSGNQYRQLGLNKISEYFDFKISIEELALKESRILSDFDFRVFRTTIFDFMNYYLSLGFLSFDELEKIKGPWVAEHKLEVIELLLLSMNFEALKYPLFNYYEKSVVACSFIATVRRSLGLTSWTNELICKTFHNLSELNECMNDIFLINFESLKQGTNVCQQNTITQAYMRNSLTCGSIFAAEKRNREEQFDEISIFEQLMNKTIYQGRQNDGFMNPISLESNQNQQANTSTVRAEQTNLIIEETHNKSLSDFYKNDDFVSPLYKNQQTSPALMGIVNPPGPSLSIQSCSLNQLTFTCLKDRIPKSENLSNLKKTRRSFKLIR